MRIPIGFVARNMKAVPRTLAATHNPVNAVITPGIASHNTPIAVVSHATAIVHMIMDCASFGFS